MNLVHRLPAAAIWGLLVVATGVSWLLAEDVSAGKAATIGIFLIAAIKIRVVMDHFMEVPWVARPWRLLLEFWLCAVTAIVIGIYLSPFG